MRQQSLCVSLCLFCFSLPVQPAAGIEDGGSDNHAAAPTARTAKKLMVFPSEIRLSSARDTQTFVVQVEYSDGVTQDVTGEISCKLDSEEIAKITANQFNPVADGSTTAIITFADFEIRLPITVVGATLDPKLSFRNDIMPVFSKVGCNTGSCHGAARGKDGFRLSLFGFDPDGDWFRLTREMPGRRIDMAVPDECLLVSKATGQVAHTGGTLFEKDSPSHQAVLRWLREGAAKDTGPIPSVEQIQLYPESGLLNGDGATQQLTVRAIYSNGTDRDVTSLAYFQSGNDNSISVDQYGRVTAHSRGEAFVTARFDTQTTGTPFIVLPKDLEFAWPNEAEANYIDARINHKLKQLRVLPSAVCSDAEFIRRVSIDICGAVPTSEEVTSFGDSQADDKRAALIDELLERKSFVDFWVMKWSELLQIRSLDNLVSYKAALLYYTWLQQQISGNVPIDEMVRDILGSEGGTFSTAATNYFQNEQNDLKVAENVAQVFMGIRIQCAQCHNHPFDRWTMDDYYSFAAFFSQLGRKPAEDPRETIIFDRGNGETTHPVTGQNMPPKFLGGEAPDTKGKDRRAVLAGWLTSADNPYFATNLSNIVWAHFFGRGIVHEVDDVRISNPAVNQPLLDEMGLKLTEYKYDFKQLVRDICNSRTYQRSTQTNESNESDLTNFSHASLRRIRAEVLLDVISQITGTQNKFRGLPVGARAVQIADGNTSTYFLSTFGRASRETVCSCEVKAEPNLSQALHFLNGETTNEKIKEGKLIETLLAEGKAPAAIIDEIYLRCLARRPTEAEMANLIADTDSPEKQLAALQDIFWAVLNSKEFLFNH